MRGGRYVPEEVKIRQAISVTVGFDHTCVLYTDGTPYCWGWGSTWLGTDGLAEDTRQPRTINRAAATNGGSDGGYKQAVVPLDSVGKPVKMSQLNAGRYHTCGIRVDNRLAMCWGRDDFAQGVVPKEVKIGNWDREIGTVLGISAGTYNTCLIREQDKRGICFGDNKSGQSNYPMLGLNIPFDLEKLKVDPSEILFSFF